MLINLGMPLANPELTSAWGPYVPDAKAPWNLARVVHLHRRAGFAASWDELQRDLKDAPEADINHMLDGKPRSEGVPEGFEATSTLLADAAVASNDPGRLKAWWVYRMLFGPDPHAERLGELSGALRAFLDDLAGASLAERVLVLGFSEFGRRVAENGSAGTDHGTSGPVLLAGPSVRPGLSGPYPSLTDLEAGDLKMVVDFRRVYATISERWLNLPADPALGKGLGPSLPLFRI